MYKIGIDGPRKEQVASLHIVTPGSIKGNVKRMFSSETEGRVDSRADGDGGTPGARSLRAFHAASRRPPAGLRAPPVFCDHRFQHLFIQTQIHGVSEKELSRNISQKHWRSVRHQLCMS